MLKYIFLTFFGLETWDPNLFIKTSRLTFHTKFLEKFLWEWSEFLSSSSAFKKTTTISLEFSAWALNVMDILVAGASRDDNLRAILTRRGNNSYICFWKKSTPEAIITPTQNLRQIIFVNA